MIFSINARLLPRIIAIFSILTISIVGGVLTACDFNIEIIDEKRSLNQIGGTSRCEKEYRISKGSAGTHRLRIFLVDDHSTPEALELKGIDQEPFNLAAKSFVVAKKTDHESAEVKVLNADDGSPASGVSVSLSMETGDNSLTVSPNPRYAALKETVGNRRVPKAVYLLIGMSDTAADQDTRVNRTSTAGIWIIENFNEDSTRGDIDIFSTLLVRGDVVSGSDVIFKSWDRDEDKYIGSDGFRGFLYTTKMVKDLISTRFTNTTNSQVTGDPPLYEAISAAATELRKVSREGDTLLFNPSIIAISLERDHHLIDKNNPNKLSAAVAGVRGGGFPDTSDLTTADFVPLQAILYPRPEKTSVADWDKHADNLCTIAQAGGASKLNYWSNLFHVNPSNSVDESRDNLKAQLDMAYHAMSGYLEMKVKYALQGGQKGKRYIISFKLKAKLLDRESRLESTPRISFVVQL